VCKVVKKREVRRRAHSHTHLSCLIYLITWIQPHTDKTNPVDHRDRRANQGKQLKQLVTAVPPQEARLRLARSCTYSAVTRSGFAPTPGRSTH
jgi:hypothetical protein